MSMNSATANTVVAPHIARAPIGPGPEGRKPKWLTPGRAGLYVFLIIAALFFALPLYLMLVTSFKTLGEIRLGYTFALPTKWTIGPWIAAWSTACSGLTCKGVSVGFWNSVRIVVPTVSITLLLGAMTGYALSFWRARGANLLFATMLLGAFLPGQIFIYPLVMFYATVHMSSSLAALVGTHVIFGLPIVTLLFRNYYGSLPIELFKAARVDGGRFFSIFWYVILPMSMPIIAVALILNTTGVWNDFIMGLVFGGRNNRPMTVELINIVAPYQAFTAYNVNMAAATLTALVPLAIYFASGRLFVRGIAGGAVKG